ncbi:hypothetical protein ACEPPN_002397 [Leptodophora sp. 'Broadleaf-Isolate-01']
MSNENTQFRYTTPEEESANGSDHGSSTGYRNGRNGKKGKKGKAKKPHYQYDPETERENRSIKDMNDMIRAVDSARQHLSKVDDMYAQLSQDIQEAVQNRKRVAELEKQCQQKHDKIEKLQGTVDDIMERSGKRDEKLEKKKLEIEEAEKAVEKKMAEVDKLRAREVVKAKEAELERSQAHDAELKKQRLAQELELKECREKLEKDFKQLGEDERKKVADLEAEKKLLLGQVKELQTKTDAYVKKLAAEKERCEDMEKLKKFSKDEALESKKELQKMKDEFGLESNTREFFQKKFNEISSQVHTISTKFCQDLNPKVCTSSSFLKLFDPSLIIECKDWTLLHEKLKALEPCLASIPISGSDDSKLLRIVHAERIISSNLTTIFFKPFSSDNTFQSERQDAIDLLEQVTLGLENSGDSKRAAAVFKSLAIRGFQSLGPLQTTSAPCARIEAFLEAVKSVLSLLVPETQYASLEDALRALVQSTISLWKSVQCDEFLDIKASLDLDPSLQTEWRSSFFDPEGDADDTAVASPSHSGIFTLFPKITAKCSIEIAEPKVKIPGSFDESKIGTQVHEICIHPGIGLFKDSALVLRAEEEQNEIEEELHQAKLMLELEATKKAQSERNKMKLQRNGSMSGPPSPITDWSIVGGHKKLPEE